MNPSELLVPAGVVTVSAYVPRCVPFAAEICAVIVFEFTTTTLLTVRWLARTATDAPDVKFAPEIVTFTVLPRFTDCGVTDDSVGAAEAGWVGASVDAFTVNPTAVLVPALVLTLIEYVPVDADAPIDNVAWICDALTTLTPLTVTPEPPPIFTAAPDWKFEPVSVILTLLPCVPLLGEIALSTGA